MNYKAFSKTLLNVYNSLEAVCERIDKMVDNKALAGVGDCYCGYKNAFELFNGIINLSQRKVNLINLKIRIEQAITKLKTKEAKVLILKFVDRLTFQQIADLTNQSLRNCFRVCENAVENFGKIIKNQGLTEEKIDSTYSCEKWLFQIYDMQEISKEKEKIKNENYQTSYRSPIITGRDISRIASKSVLSL